MRVWFEKSLCNLLKQMVQGNGITVLVSIQFAYVITNMIDKEARKVQNEQLPPIPSHHPYADAEQMEGANIAQRE